MRLNIQRPVLQKKETPAGGPAGVILL